MRPLPCTTPPADVPEQRQSLPRRNWQSILQKWRTRVGHVLLFAVKRAIDPLHGPIRGSREIASAILKAIPTRKRKARAAQLFLVSGSQNQVRSPISMARTTKELLRHKKGCYIGLHVLKATRCATLREDSHGIPMLQTELTVRHRWANYHRRAPQSYGASQSRRCSHKEHPLIRFSLGYATDVQSIPVCLAAYR